MIEAQKQNGKEEEEEGEGAEGGREPKKKSVEIVTGH